MKSYDPIALNFNNIVFNQSIGLKMTCPCQILALNIIDMAIMMMMMSDPFTYYW